MFRVTEYRLCEDAEQAMLTQIEPITHRSIGFHSAKVTSASNWPSGYS